MPLYVTARGLTTSPMPYRGEAVELEFDLHEHRLNLRTSDDHQGLFALRPMPVADFYREVRELLAAAGVEVRIHPVPVEVADAVPFHEDTAAGSYEAEQARALHGALLNAQRVLTRFRGGFLGKSSPVHFFWGGFDLAETRFSGRPAPPHPGGIPNCPPYVMAEAYSHEVSSAGWWAGPPEVGAVFYAYMYPEPPAYPTTSIAPAPGFYHTTLREFVVPYNDVAGSADPDATLLAFLEATYAAGATSAGWDRESLERHQPESTA